MSTEIIVALIGLAGVLLAPLLQSAAAGRPVRRLTAVILFAIGMVLLVGAGVRLWSPAGDHAAAIDLGSTWDARDGRLVGELDGRERFIYRHTPRGQLRYTRVTVDGALVRVHRVCGLRTEDVTRLFSRANLGQEGSPVYTSGLLDVPVGCRIEFVVRPSGGETIGIELVAEAAR